MMNATEQPLPVERILGELDRALRCSPAAILQAPPGSGKTTRVPPALLEADWLSGRRILMLEPRRLAAVGAARYMADCRDEPVGKTIGYTVRYDRAVSAATRIEVITEGLLTRRMQADPELPGVGLVIFDEFHERSLDADLALAICRDIQQALRPDLRLLVMSATLDVEPLARLLDDCPVVRTTGRSFPVAIHHLPEADSRDPVTATVQAVRRALAETTGDLLVFLPGAAAIRECQQRLSDLSGALSLHPLFGGLAFAEQQAALRPGPRRKVVLATNIAETSLTIEGISTVVDSGLERRPRFDAARGMQTLETVRISLASAEQRAGRAGRLGPGTCYRLWSPGTHGTLLPFAPPEIVQADLAPLALDLARWGVADPGELAWLDPPPAGHLKAARRLLQMLGALDDSHRLSPVGRQMAEFPAHPRLARLLLEAQAAGCEGSGADVAALLSEPNSWPRPQSQPGDPRGCDLREHLAKLRDQPRTESPNLRRALRYWRKRLAVKSNSAENPAMVGRLVAAGFPDRLACQRQPGSDRYLLRSGQGARLAAGSAVRDAPWLVGIELVGRSGAEGLITLASALDPADVEDLFGAQAHWQREVAWEDDAQRVVVREVRRLGSLVIQERPVSARAEDRLPTFLALVQRSGLEVLPWSPAARQLRARVQLLRVHHTAGDWPDWSDAALLGGLETWLAPGLTEVRTKADLQRLDLVPLLKNQLGWERLPELERLAPERLEVPSGAKVRLDYQAGEMPVLAVKLQEMFGLAETPTVARGCVPVQIHLLSPAGRALAVTQDLASFWTEVYPEVQKEMKGRYPKHPWPDDPWHAVATGGVKSRRR